MTQLIVALDVDLPLTLAPQLAEAGINFFKLNHLSMMSHSFLDTMDWMRDHGCDVFLDLKLYDTRDTVERVAHRAFELGARFLTVHATPSMLGAAMRAKPPGDYHKVLAVGDLTDSGSFHSASIAAIAYADGLVCRVQAISAVRRASGTHIPKLTVCPGIRHADGDYNIEQDNHVNPATPAEAKAAGADFIVVGRPIIDAPDPVAAARAIMREIG